MLSDRRGFKLFYFLVFAAFSGYLMFRNVYLEEIGMSGTQMGIVGLLYPLCTMVAQPVWGVLADWKQASKAILYASAVVAGLAMLAYPLAPLVSSTFLAVVVGTAVLAAFRAPTMPIANALVLSAGMSYENVRAYGSVAFGVAGLGFGFLVGVTATEVVFYAFTGGMVLVVLLLTRLPVEQPEGLGGDLELSAIRRLLDRQFLLLVVAAFVIGLMTPAGVAFFSVYVRAVGHADWITGVAWLIKTLGEAVAFLAISRRGGRYRWLMAAGGLLYLGTYVVLALTANVGVIVAAQVMLGVGYALFNLASVNLAHVLAPAALASTAQSLLLVGGTSAGRVVGELLAGVLVEHVGAQAMYLYVAALGLIVPVVSLRIAATAQDGGVEDGSAS